MENRDKYMAEDVTALAATDAYHWLRLAKNIDSGKLDRVADPLKGYPDMHPYPHDPSLLAHFISLATHFTGGDYYRGALWLPPLFAGLFVIPLFLYFHSIGFGASSILGGLIGSFSLAYYSRSAFGFVDTDILNLFFPMLVSALAVQISRDRPFRSNLLLAAGAGASLYLFNWWYQQPLFFLVFLPFIAGYLCLIRLPGNSAM